MIHFHLLIEESVFLSLCVYVWARIVSEEADGLSNNNRDTAKQKGQSNNKRQSWHR